MSYRLQFEQSASLKDNEKDKTKSSSKVIEPIVVQTKGKHKLLMRKNKKKKGKDDSSNPALSALVLDLVEKIYNKDGRYYLSPSHLGNPEEKFALEWVNGSGSDWMWTIVYDEKMWAQIFINGMFVLPFDNLHWRLKDLSQKGARISSNVLSQVHPQMEILTCPNPTKRFCLDLRATSTSTTASAPQQSEVMSDTQKESESKEQASATKQKSNANQWQKNKK
ncbi:hypothetical protein RFI_07600 [Reticulomyxa filosa]|uniref:Uncharacterized protein n=1 Tax=Reticulomyxa filosa TaxID=46433 RepID=X6NUQ3_RETFI|nr:hypothetical protein RFI_07600 [Reticulomyxa filosa]|eukprot:ETO29519.1 hypothetical protein RFI_07600 [Reticulomyxa filosa]